MVQDKALPGKPLYELRSYRKISGVNEDVIGKIEFFQHRNTAQKIWLKQKIIGLALDNVANPDEFWISCERFQLRAQTRGTQVDPAYDSKNEGIVRGEFQQPARFVQRLPNLDENSSLKRGLFQLRL